jgi:hypothetical protein
MQRIDRCSLRTILAVPRRIRGPDELASTSSSLHRWSIREREPEQHSAFHPKWERIQAEVAKLLGSFALSLGPRHLVQLAELILHQPVVEPDREFVFHGLRPGRAAPQVCSNGSPITPYSGNESRQLTPRDLRAPSETPIRARRLTFDRDAEDLQNRALESPGCGPRDNGLPLKHPPACNGRLHVRLDHRHPRQPVPIRASPGL